MQDPTKADDLSFIKKVVFKLHDTIRNPLRTVEEPPFEITETGWGEFEVIIKIFFLTEANEKPVQFYHHLKLHPYNGVGPNNGIPKVRENGVVESILYDELIFNEPTEAFFKIITNKPGHLLNQKKTEENVFSLELEAEELYRINNGLATVQEQILSERKRLQELELEKQKLENAQEKKSEK